MATHTSPSGTKTRIPAPGDIADGPLALAQFADSVEPALPPIGAVLPYFGTNVPDKWYWYRVHTGKTNIHCITPPSECWTGSTPRKEK